MGVNHVHHGTRVLNDHVAFSAVLTGQVDPPVLIHPAAISDVDVALGFVVIFALANIDVFNHTISSADTPVPDCIRSVNVDRADTAGVDLTATDFHPFGGAERSTEDVDFTRAGSRLTIAGPSSIKLTIDDNTSWIVKIDGQLAVSVAVTTDIELIDALTKRAVNNGRFNRVASRGAVMDIEVPCSIIAHDDIAITEVGHSELNFATEEVPSAIAAVRPVSIKAQDEPVICQCGASALVHEALAPASNNQAPVMAACCWRSSLK